MYDTIHKHLPCSIPGGAVESSNEPETVLPVLQRLLQQSIMLQTISAVESTDNHEINIEILYSTLNLTRR